MKNRKDIIENEKFTLEVSEYNLKKLEASWFKSSSMKGLIDFLKIYIEKKNNFIKELEKF